MGGKNYSFHFKFKHLTSLLPVDMWLVRVRFLSVPVLAGPSTLLRPPAHFPFLQSHSAICYPFFCSEVTVSFPCSTYLLSLAGFMNNFDAAEEEGGDARLIFLKTEIFSSKSASQEPWEALDSHWHPLPPPVLLLLVCDNRTLWRNLVAVSQFSREPHDWSGRSRWNWRLAAKS